MTSANIQTGYVELFPLEKDERVAELQKQFIRLLKKERGYEDLDSSKKTGVDAVLQSLASMRFETKQSLEQVALSLLANVAPELDPYVPLSLNNAAKNLPSKQGVLVIYTGGTIGSAPKDLEDPDSPQVVKPWKDLKQAIPQLNHLGYPVDAISFVEPLDSCNVGPAHWRTMAKIITDHYDQYEGFVILHGTDSMVYTASALSFMLLHLAKPIAITGSQVAGVVNPRNDAHQNMITAVMLANPKANHVTLIPEVFVVFGNLVSRGNRSKKMDVIGYQGFKSPNYDLLGETGEFITVHRKNIRPIPETDLQVFDQLDTNVIILEVFPGMQNSPILSNILKDEKLRGVVLKSYGAGNIPTDPDFLKLFKDFIDKGGVVVNVTSVPEGEVVMGLYETSQILVDRGIIGGFDITPEAALCKLMMLLGTYGDDVETVKALMQQSLAGEQRLSLRTTLCVGKQELSASSLTVNTAKGSLESEYDSERIEKVMLRFKNAAINPGTAERVTIKVVHDGIELGAFKRGKVPENALIKDASVGESVAFDITAHKHLFLKKDSSGPIKSVQKVGFEVTLQSTDSSASFIWEDLELNIYVAD